MRWLWKCIVILITSPERSCGAWRSSAAPHSMDDQSEDRADAADDGRQTDGECPRRSCLCPPGGFVRFIIVGHTWQWWPDRRSEVTGYRFNLVCFASDSQARLAIGPSQADAAAPAEPGSASGPYCCAAALRAYAVHDCHGTSPYCRLARLRRCNFGAPHSSTFCSTLSVLPATL